MKKAIAPSPAPLTGTAAERLAQLNAQLVVAAARGDHPSPTLIAVSKTFAADAIQPMITAGQRVFGENRVQEAMEKWPPLRALEPGITLHLVGQLQSNKAAQAVQLFDAIHSLDRPSLVTALARAMDASGRRPQLFIQVNLGRELQKGGVSPEDLTTLLANARSAGLAISGLMTVPPADREPAPYFALLARMAADNGLPLLSMGMSDDYDIAAALGATHVRIGSALFGRRL